ncbi:LamG-like jellyroll fold domain-containing protein [Kribbella speibonae]|uniref:FlgD/Vpr Ig-like domain-containing protein n=1 Tax=Kribbella speibonae TaxID=1572660 RepID=A0A4R0IE72_9ACTN|nr:LamG-like jellyroll fold domain-containing protein [Kribbella speibonae]TCC30264.1 hypothetical protein E0H92_40590 [Kribbella speibonae]
MPRLGKVLLVLATLVMSAPPGPAADVLGTVPVPPGSKLSAAIYDEHGQVVRHLYDLASRTGTVEVRWDGKDDSGQDTRGGKYSWRAITSSVSGTYDGEVGDGGRVVPGLSFEASDNQNATAGVTYGPDGDLYLVSRYEEMAATHVRRIAPADLSTGKQKWFAPGQPRGHGIAVDDRYVYVASFNDKATDYRIVRRDAITGKATEWGNPIVTTPWTVGQPVVTGLAVDATYLWVADTATGQLRVYTKADGKPAPILAGQSTMKLTAAPHGIVTDGANRFWITAGDHVQRYRYDAASATMKPELSIGAGLLNPFGLAWDKATNALYVSEIGTGRIRKYDATSGAERSTPLHLSTMPAPGKVTDYTVGWKYDTDSQVPGGDAAIALAPDGKTLVVVDYWNGRTLFFDTVTGLARPERQQGQNIPVPDVDVKVGQDRLTSFGREYRIDYNAPGRPWKLAANWAPQDRANQYSISATMIRKLANGKEYEYVFLGQRCSDAAMTNCAGQQPGTFPFGGVLVYQLNASGQGMRPVAQLRRLSPAGGPRNQFDIGDRLAITTNTNDNAVLGDAGDVTEKLDHAGFLLGNPSIWVDNQGTLWMANASTITATPDHIATPGVGRLPMKLTGDIPVYSAAGFAIQPGTEHDQDPATGIGTNNSYQVTYDTANQRLYASTDTGEFDHIANYGGNAVSMWDLRTGQKSVFSGYSPLAGQRHRVRDSPVGLAVDSSGGYFYTGRYSGEAQQVVMHTWDGLPVGRAATALPTYSTGWLDRGMSLTAFTHTNGTRYAYTEDNYNGMNNRFAFSDANSVRRYGSDPSTGSTAGDFTRPRTPITDDLVAWLRMDSGRTNDQYVGDSAGDRWGVYQTKGRYTWWQPSGGARVGALAFDSAQSNAIHFRKHSGSDKAVDNLLDAPDQPATTFATWFKTKSSGVLASYQDRYDNADVKPTKAQPMLYVGVDGKLRGGALTAAGCAVRQVVSPNVVNDDTWHHVALVTTATGQTMYLDGQRVGDLQCGRVAGGLGFSLLGKGYTSLGTWPSTPGGYFYYTGSLDDARVYHRALAAAEVAELATVPAPSGPFAHWKFDESGGTVAADAADHSQEAIVTPGAVWHPSTGDPRVGGALEFDGSSTMATIPQTLTVNAPLTVSVWVNTTKGGPVLGDQRGAYPTTMPGHVLAYVPVPGNEDITISTTDGRVRSNFAGVPLGGPTTGPDVRDGKWHQIVVTTQVNRAPDGNPLFLGAIYIDGVQIASGPPVPNVQGVYARVRPNAQFGAARSPNNTWTYYTGQLGDAKLWTRTLTPTEIKALG